MGLLQLRIELVGYEAKNRKQQPVRMRDRGARLSQDQGRAEPDCLRTAVISALFTTPSTVTSARKLDESVTLPDCLLVWLISAELTTPSPLVSPSNSPAVTLAEETV